MGYAVLHLDKAPGNEAAMTAHIARTKIPTNASPERTCLNEELVEFPEEVADRTEAISYRLEHAGLTRKIGTNQVRVIRVMLTGSHDAMKRIEEEGRLPEWCADNLAWLRETFGTENVVSAVVHRDESTPHIHAAVVPIVTGERRKARTVPSETPGKRHYRPKSAARPRLCADDVMSRVRLKQYQDTYAAAMSKYGLERGIDGSEARHITTQEFYRQTIAQQQDLQENIDALLRLEEQKRKAVEQLKQQERQVRTEYEQTATLQAQKSAELNRTEAELKSVKGELKGARLKNAAAEVGSNIVEGIGAMIGTSRVKRQQQEIDRLNAENAALHEQIGTLNRANREEKVRHEQAEQQLQAKLDPHRTLAARHADAHPLGRILPRHGNPGVGRPRDHRHEAPLRLGRAPRSGVFAPLRRLEYGDPPATRPERSRRLPAAHRPPTRTHLVPPTVCGAHDPPGLPRPPRTSRHPTTYH